VHLAVAGEDGHHTRDEAGIDQTLELPSQPSQPFRREATRGHRSQATRCDERFFRGVGSKDDAVAQVDEFFAGWHPPGELDIRPISEPMPVHAGRESQEIAPTAVS